MELILNKESEYVLRLDPGDEFISSIQSFCENQKIDNAWLEAIGSTKELELAYFNLEKKDYDKTLFNEFLEVVNITGNIAIKEGKPFCHAHGTFARKNMEALAGHVVKCVVSATLEVSLRVLGGSMARTFNDEANLHLLS